MTNLGRLAGIIGIVLHRGPTHGEFDMARREQDREDLMREATALVERLELEVPEFSEPVIIGFRRNGCPSFFFGANFVLQFNSSGELRRGFQDGCLIKAERRQLFMLEHQRGEREIVLRSIPLGPERTEKLLKLAEHHLGALWTGLATHSLRIIRQIPPQASVGVRILDWIANHASPIAIADRPNAV